MQPPPNSPYGAPVWGAQYQQPAEYAPPAEPPPIDAAGAGDLDEMRKALVHLRDSITPVRRFVRFLQITIIVAVVLLVAGAAVAGYKAYTVYVPLKERMDLEVSKLKALAEVKFDLKSISVMDFNPRTQEIVLRIVLSAANPTEYDATLPPFTLDLRSMEIGNRVFFTGDHFKPTTFAPGRGSELEIVGVVSPDVAPTLAKFIDKEMEVDAHITLHPKVEVAEDVLVSAGDIGPVEASMTIRIENASGKAIEPGAFIESIAGELKRIAETLDNITRTIDAIGTPPDTEGLRASIERLEGTVSKLDREFDTSGLERSQAELQGTVEELKAAVEALAGGPGGSGVPGNTGGTEGGPVGGGFREGDPRATPSPTPRPTAAPTATPSSTPTATPSATPSPTPRPTAEPTAAPSSTPGPSTAPPGPGLP